MTPLNSEAWSNTWKRTVTTRDWDQIRTQYVTGQVSYRDLAKQHKFSYRQVAEKGRTERWVEQRRDFRKRAAAEGQQLVQEEAAEATALIFKVGRLILERFLKAVQEEGLKLSPRDAERWARILLELEEAGKGRLTVIERVDLSQLSDEDLDAIIQTTASVPPEGRGVRPEGTGTE